MFFQSIKYLYSFIFQRMILLPSFHMKSYYYSILNNISKLYYIFINKIKLSIFINTNTYHLHHYNILQMLIAMKKYLAYNLWDIIFT